jgi:hypothetical protein
MERLGKRENGFCACFDQPGEFFSPTLLLVGFVVLIARSADWCAMNERSFTREKILSFSHSGMGHTSIIGTNK